MSLRTVDDAELCSELLRRVSLRSKPIPLVEMVRNLVPQLEETVIQRFSAPVDLGQLKR